MRNLIQDQRFTTREHLSGRLCRVPPIVLTLALFTLGIAQQRNALPTPEQIQANETFRERFQNVPEVIKALEVREGSWVADVGAWWGFFTVRIAPLVGKSGRVFAVEIQKDLVGPSKQRARDAKLDNIEPILGDVDDPKLPANRLDSVLIVNSYHEMEYYKSMLRHIFQSLKPGGRLVMIEPSQESHRDRTREKQVEHHEIAPGIAEEEIREAGLQILQRRDPFIPPSRDLQEYSGPGAWWMIIASRPLALEMKDENAITGHQHDRAPD